MKILCNSHWSGSSYFGFTPLSETECDPLSVPFCFEYTNILCISMSDRMQNLQIFIFRCMGKKQLELKMWRMKNLIKNYQVIPLLKQAWIDIGHTSEQGRKKGK